MQKQFLFLFLFLAFLCSCSTDERDLMGRWEYDSMDVGMGMNTQAESMISQLMGGFYTDSYVEFNSDGTCSGTIGYLLVIADGSHWKLDDKKENILITGDAGFTQSLPFRISGKELRIQQTVGTLILKRK